jgi:hypothetical protein
MRCRITGNHHLNYSIKQLKQPLDINFIIAHTVDSYLFKHFVGNQVNRSRRRQLHFHALISQQNQNI